ERGTGYIGENASNNLDEPVSDLIDAAVGATPQYCYTPGMKARFEMFLARYLPIYLIELMFLLFQYCYTPGMKAKFEMFLARYLPIYLTDIYTEMKVNLKFPAAVGIGPAVLSVIDTFIDICRNLFQFLRERGFSGTLRSFTEDRRRRLDLIILSQKIFQGYNERD
ncbi:unnamed protein product, partial [Timema podura]|nr:unnamed protein product [Timema podura]